MAVMRLLVDCPHDGAWNMAVDELLLDLAAEKSQGALRFYRWRQATLSLGYFQRYADRSQHAASAHCPVVRRLSGGGAIVHDQEMTYSLALPAGDPAAVDKTYLYRLVHRGLIAALRELGISAALCAEAASGDSLGEELLHARRGLVAHLSRAQTHGDNEPFLCFARRASADVLCGGHKVAGSAQRRRRGAVLQHGSLILRRSEAAPEIAGLSELAHSIFELEELVELWACQLASALGTYCQPDALTAAEAGRAAELAESRYSHPSWTQAR